MVAAQQPVELGRLLVGPGGQHSAVDHLAAHPRRHRLVAEGEVHGGGDLTETRGLGGERRALLLHRASAFRLVARSGQLGLGVEVAQRGECQRPTLGAVGKEGLDQGEQAGLTGPGEVLQASQGRGDVAEARGPQRLGHLQLGGDPRLDPPEALHQLTVGQHQ